MGPLHRAPPMIAWLAALLLCIVASRVFGDEQKRPTFLDKAIECEAKCDGRRKSLPECDLFCIDEACFNRVFGTIDLMGGSSNYDLNDAKKLESFTRCAKLRLLPAVPAAYREKKALREEQRRQMNEWRARMEARRTAAEREKQAVFERQLAERAKLDS